MNWQVFLGRIERGGGVGFVLSLGKYFALLSIFFIAFEGYAQAPGNTRRQLEAVERTFADLSQRNAYVESLEYNDLPMAH